MRIFISGGCKNGKSFYAQRLAKLQGENAPLYYVATMRPVDAEDGERIRRHRGEREGWGFITVEQPRDISEIAVKCDQDGSLLLDSVTALLANEMFSPGEEVDRSAAEKIANEIDGLLNKFKNIVIVSDTIYSDAMVYEQLTEEYRMALARIDRTAAMRCDAVLEVSFSNVIMHKGAIDGIDNWRGVPG